MPELSALRIHIGSAVYHFQIQHAAVSVARQPTDPHFTFTAADNRYVTRVYDAATQIWDHAALRGLAACYEYRRGLEGHAHPLNNLTVGEAIRSALRIMGATQTEHQETHRIVIMTNDENDMSYLEHDLDDSAHPYTLTVHFGESGLESATQPKNMTMLWEKWIGGVSVSDELLDDTLFDTLDTAAIEKDQAESTRQFNWSIPIALPVWTVDWEAWRAEEFLRQGSMNIPAESWQAAEHSVQEMLDQLFPNLYPDAQIVFTSVLAKKDA